MVNFLHFENLAFNSIIALLGEEEDITGVKNIYKEIQDLDIKLLKKVQSRIEYLLLRQQSTIN